MELFYSGADILIIGCVCRSAQQVFFIRCISKCMHASCIMMMSTSTRASSSSRALLCRWIRNIGVCSLIIQLYNIENG